MKHGAFHNNDCKYCQVMEKITAVVAILLIVGIEIWLVVQQRPAHVVLIMAPLGLLTAVIAHFIVRRCVPQSHGIIADYTSDVSWYRKSNKK